MMGIESDVAVQQPSQTNRWSYVSQNFNIETTQGVFSKLKLWGANPQRLDSSVEPEVVVCVRSGSYTFGEQRPMHHTERSRVSPMHHGPGKWRSKTTRGGLAMAPRGIGTSHGVCRTTRVPCADLPRFGFYTAVSTIFRGLGLEPALLLLLRAQPWPSGGRCAQSKGPITGRILELEALTWINRTGRSCPSG